MKNIEVCLNLLDKWLDSCRVKEGYGGPVVHWWGESLTYTGVGTDWRYEGIITAYLNLYKKSWNEYWLNKAVMAGNDLVKLQLKDGYFPTSCFELNPTAGTLVHQAGCDIGLLELYKTTKEEQFLNSAERNIYQIIDKYWDSTKGQYHAFVDRTTSKQSFYYSPNMAATFTEALMTLLNINGDKKLEPYINKTLRYLLSIQVQKGRLEGGIFEEEDHSSIYSFYVARYVPVFLKQYEITKENEFKKAADKIVKFLLSLEHKQGGFYHFISYNGNKYDKFRWIAGTGDILRALHLAKVDESIIKKHVDWILHYQHPSGGVQSSITKKQRFNDVIPVVGWCDKTFRLLSLIANGEVINTEYKKTVCECILKGKHVQYEEDKKHMAVTYKGKIFYLWKKGGYSAEYLRHF